MSQFHGNSFLALGPRDRRGPSHSSAVSSVISPTLRERIQVPIILNRNIHGVYSAQAA